MDYRRHGIESFSGTYGGRLAQQCGSVLVGRGTEAKVLNALYKVIPQRALRVVHRADESVNDGQARRIDELEFRLGPRGRSRLRDSFVLHFREAGVTRAYREIYSRDGIKVTFGLRTLEIQIRNSDPTDQHYVTLHYGLDGQISVVEIDDLTWGDWNGSYFEVSEEIEVEWEEATPTSPTRLILPGPTGR